MCHIHTVPVGFSVQLVFDWDSSGSGAHKFGSKGDYFSSQLGSEGDFGALEAMNWYLMWATLGATNRGLGKN